MIRSNFLKTNSLLLLTRMPLPFLHSGLSVMNLLEQGGGSPQPTTGVGTGRVEHQHRAACEDAEGEKQEAKLCLSQACFLPRRLGVGGAGMPGRAMDVDSCWSCLLHLPRFGRTG